MVQSLEAIKGGGGSIRVGTTGTISSLMTRELDSMKSASQKPLSPPPSSSSSSTNKPQSVALPKRLTPMKSFDFGGTSSSSSSGNIKCTNQDIGRKTRGSAKSKNTHRIPMLGSDNISLDRTPSREKSDKKGSLNIVEVVDIKCGNLDNGNRAWTIPITSKLRKLGFSKLSESIV